MNPVARARAYLAKLPPAISGQHGHAATFTAACRLVEFGLSFEQALPLLAEWNQTHCRPPWTAHELRHKLRDAFRKTAPRPEFTATPSPGDRVQRASLSCAARFEFEPTEPTGPTANAGCAAALARVRPARGNGELIARLAALRRLAPEAVALAQERGLVRFGIYRCRAAWFVLDATGRAAQARRLDGEPWFDGVKALNLRGSQAAWPVGIGEAAPFPVLALVEGGPDLLAAFHFIWRGQRQTDCAPVAMLSACPPIHRDALDAFAGKRVRIFGHADAPGERAAARWSNQLDAVAARVDVFSFAGLRRAEGQPIKDLCDLAAVSLETFNSRETPQSLLP